MFKIITTKKQKEIEEMIIKKLKFVARSMVYELGHFNTKEECDQKVKDAEFRAEQVFYVDEVI